MLVLVPTRASRLMDAERSSSLRPFCLCISYKKKMDGGNDQCKNLGLSTTDKSETSITNKKMRNFTSEPYPMNVPGRKRGLALIFSHAKFLTSDSPRPTTEVDNNRLKSILKNFGFDVKICQDYRKQQIFKELLEVSKMDHSNNECLAIFVMTHGSPGRLAAHDQYYEVCHLWSYFTETECPTLSGKPKLFFIQACRGDSSDAGTFIQFKSDNYIPYTPSSSSSVHDTTVFCNPKESEVPIEPDFVVAYSTIPGHYAYASVTNGSWFITELCNVLDTHGRKYDLLTLLTFVAQLVAIDYRTCCSYLPANDKKQITSTNSTLERPLYFFPDEVEKVPEKLKL